MKKTLTNPVYHKLIAAALLVGGTFQLAAPIIAAGTSAGTGISNTATATYNDPNNPTEVIDATSNTVQITVAEVAGITAVASGVTDSTPGSSVLPGDRLTYDYTITNVGNDPTNILIPAPVVTGPATQTGAITYDIDADGNGTYETPAANLTTATTTAIAPGGSIRVHIPVVVDATATSGAPIVVRLGDTAPNDNSAATQNQPYTASTVTNGDVRTSDIAGEAAPNTAAPTNGEREASATQQILVGAQPQAFATVLKTQGAYSDAGTAGVFNDDLQTYNLSLRVESAAPTGASAGLVPADLEGTPVSVDGISANRILVSDAIPAGTALLSTNVAPVAPTGGAWTVVYTVTPLTTNANAAAWTATRPASGITRVGFVSNGPVTRGTTVTGFSFQVTTNGLNAANGGTIANLAQLFGETVGGGTTIVYDESGDQSPSNFNDNGTRGPNTGVDNPQSPDGIPEPIIGSGVANPTTDENDPTGTNTGTGVGGEDNILILAPTGTVLNGPNGAPAAVGPTNNNDDFTNQSTDIPAGTVPGALIDPAPEVFTNTLSAPTTTLTNVLLRPDDGTATGTLPLNSTVTITYNGSSAVYTYRDTNADNIADSFVFTSGTAIQIPSISVGTSVNYTTTVDLPGGTALSTDLPAGYLNGYQAPILAFTDLNGNGVLDTGESSNTTIARVYTGFLRLVKESRILQGTGPAVIGNQGTFDQTAKTPAPGNIIEYRISYSNISTAVSGSSNVTLRASNVTITESGVTNTAVLPAAPNGNNWGQDYSTPTGIDTSNVVGSAVDSGTGATITYFSGTAGTVSATDQTGTTPATDVTRYVNTVSVPIEPGVAARTFTFRRTVN
ncbi:beta strand repeat-containing protein [Aliterella atlantica]|uniref:DUF7925 domain-containing protein n=1 Tax=Aliterella atlantica CENA595 TaxID=1618023 RepID=A0A0D8ZNS3_9CYAN|nr:hypothetical protein [Aliterella atlantica]KJH70139.1 hypothetical protein UH38_19965 [Aliterella atlantica CENA595]